MYVNARSYEYVMVKADEGDTIRISATIYILFTITYRCLLTEYRCPRTNGSDIDVEIVGPDGKLILLKQRFSSFFNYEFKAYMSGEYRIMFDNTYSDNTKIIDVAVTVIPRPTTATYTLYLTTTTTKMVTITTTTSITQSLTTTVKEPDWTTTGIIAVVLLVIGFAAGYMVGRPTKYKESEVQQAEQPLKEHRTG